MNKFFALFLFVWAAIAEADSYAQDLQKRLVMVSQKARSHEKELLKMETDLGMLEKKARQIQQLLLQRRPVYYKSLRAMQHLSRHAVDALIQSSHTADDLIHLSILLRSLTTNLEQDNEALRQEYETLVELKRKMDLKRASLKYAKEAYDEQTKKVEVLIKQRKALLKKEEAKRRRIEARNRILARRAKNVKELIATIDDSHQADGTFLPGLDKGPLDRGGRYAVLPVEGQITSGYGMAHTMNPDGVGTVFKTRPGARVLSPVSGQVVFSGPFRLYQQIIILKHHQNYYTLLAGIDRVDVEVGQMVEAGEPIGLMSFNHEAPSLYLELRLRDHPINPKAWLSGI